MPISRPLLIVLVAAVLALVGFYATQGSRDSVDNAPVVATPPPRADSTPPADDPRGAPGAAEPQAPAKQPQADKSQTKGDKSQPSAGKAETASKAKAARAKA